MIGLIPSALLVTLLALLAQLLSALLERSGPIRLRHWAEEAGGRLLALYDRPLHFEAFRFLLGWSAKFAPLALFLAFWPVFRVTRIRSALYAALTVALLMAFSELLTRSLVGRDPEGALRRLTPAYRLALTVLKPLLVLVVPLFPASVVERREDEDEVTENEIEAFINVGTTEGILEPGEEDLILRVIDFGDSVVKSVVTPRIDMVCAPADSDLEELAELFLSSKHSRIPVYQGTVDQIVGILHIRDLLQGLRTPQRPAVQDLTTAPYCVPETKPLNELLREFQALRQQLAIVVDEYGGTSGMVTIEDLLEEIVGEIDDEHDETPPRNQKLPDGGWRLDGRAPLETLHELFEIDAEEEPYETVGGLILGRLGFVPEPGERVEAHGLVLEVEKVEERRILSVVARRAEAPGHD